MAEHSRIVITYEDGSTEEYNPNKPKLLLEMERKFGIQVPEKHEHISWLSWTAMGRPLGDMDKWLDTVEYIQDSSDLNGTDEVSSSGEPDPS